MDPATRIRETNRSNRERDAREDQDWRTISESMHERGALLQRERELTGIERMAREEEYGKAQGINGCVEEI